MMNIISAQEYASSFKKLEGRRIPVDCDAVALFCVVSALQLSLRHPEFGQMSTAKVITNFIEGAKQKLDPDGGIVRQLLDMGDNPECDEIVTLGEESDTKFFALKNQLLDMIEAQHKAIDHLMAMLIKETDFMPTEWEGFEIFKNAAVTLKENNRMK